MESMEYLLDPKVGIVSPQEISDFDHYRRKKRETLSLFTRPIATSKKFGQAIAAASVYVVQNLATHYLVKFVLVPVLAAWIILDWNPGYHTETLHNIEFWVQYVVWWVGLGILSSIGLGSGLQSGLLFLLPHIVQTCLTAQTCKSLDFDSVSDIWFRTPSTLFKCPENSNVTETVTLMGMWKKIILVCFLQATGTAIGEIPPYWITRGARLAAIEAGTDEADEMPEELGESSGSSQWINQAKQWMVWFLREYGFFGVLVMASYPNIAFDLCGICCGHFLMPFWSFFIATFLGKAVIRNSYQSFFYVMMCSEVYIEKAIHVLQYLLPDALQLDELVRTVFEEGKKNFQNLQTSGGGAAASAAASAAESAAAAPSAMHVTKAWLSFGWQSFMFVLLSTFFLSCISHFAQYYEMLLDQEDSNVLRKKLPQNVRNEIMSPCSGRLRLPPPTPVTKRKPLQGTRLAAVLEGETEREMVAVPVVAPLTPAAPKIVEESEEDEEQEEEGEGEFVLHNRTLYSIAETSFSRSTSGKEQREEEDDEDDSSREGTEGEDISLSDHSTTEVEEEGGAAIGTSALQLSPIRAGATDSYQGVEEEEDGVEVDLQWDEDDVDCNDRSIIAEE